MNDSSLPTPTHKRSRHFQSQVPAIQLKLAKAKNEIHGLTYLGHLTSGKAGYKVSNSVIRGYDPKDTSVGEGVEKRELLHTLGRNVNWCTHYGKQYGGFSKN